MVKATAVGLETSTADEDYLVEASFGITNLNAVALGKRASAGGLTEIGGRYRSITLNRHYVKDTANHHLRPWQDTDEGAGVSVVFMTDLIAPSPEPRTWEPALSASRAKEYERCPLQYRLHVLDGYREPETRAKALGTLVHAVFEELFALDPSERTPQNARAQVAPQYEAFAAKNPEVGALFANDADREAWLDDARTLIDGYFAIEAPQWIAQRRASRG